MTRSGCLPAAGMVIDALFAGPSRARWPGKPPSAIAKAEMPGWLELTPAGIVGDQQADLNVHGGHDKALHHYAADHYPAWRADLGRDDLGPGGFGENLSTTGITEETLCIGDTLALGNAVVQVSQGRQPCWKLDMHTGEPRMAYLFQKTGRTGWYYRVLKPGAIRAGEVIRFLDRPNPGWTVEYVTWARLSRRIAPAEAAVLAEMVELASGWRDAFSRMAAGDMNKDTSARLGPGAG